MPRRGRPNFKPQRKPTFLRAWREHRGYNQEKFLERLEHLTGYTLSVGQLSRIENAKQEYSQDFLEAAAIVLQCDHADLLRIDPNAPDVRYTILEGLSDAQLKTVALVAQAVRQESAEKPPEEPSPAPEGGPANEEHRKAS